MTPTTQDVRNWWAPPCQADRGVTIDFGNAGAKITIDKRVVKVFEAVEAIMAKYGYTIRAGDTGAYNCRVITGGTGYSLHAYLIAVDVNWQTNPYGPVLRTDMPPAMILEIEALQVDGVQVVRWGGRYSGNKDAMHFEIIVSPILAVRFNSPVENWVLKQGSRGPRVRDLEKLLVHLGYTNVIVDGVFGPVTTAAVKDFQKLLKATPSGSVGAFTFAAFERWYAMVGGKPKAWCVGDRSAEIKATKERLVRSFSQRLVRNGKLTRATQKAIRNAQKFLGLHQTGNLDEKTRDKIAEWDRYVQSKNA